MVRLGSAAPGRGFKGRLILVLAALLAACEGPQSALQPAGQGAESIARLFWWMSGGALLIWAAVIGLAVYAVHFQRRPTTRPAQWLIVGGGILFPTVVLGALLFWGLLVLKDLRTAPAEPDLVVAVSGEQWWWRVRYLDANSSLASVSTGGVQVADPTDEAFADEAGGGIELANELHLPLGATVELRLESPDVIHAFWLPSLGGKVDMIPGQTTTLLLKPTRAGTFHGACAEYCGDSHALMKFRAVVEPREDYEAWLSAQAAPAVEPSDELGRAGRDAFLANGCGACHSIRGTAADGRMGPDLTHVGSRLSLAAGSLPLTAEALAAWIEHPALLKPGARMPSFQMLPDEQVTALAHYLRGLQ